MDITAVLGLVQWWNEFAEYHDNSKLVFGALEPLGDPAGVGVVVSVAALGMSVNQASDINNLLMHSNYTPVGLVGAPRANHPPRADGTLPDFCSDLLPPLADANLPPDRLAMLAYIMENTMQGLRDASQPLSLEDIRKMDA